MRRLLGGVGQYCCFCGFLDSILRIGFAPGGVKQGLDTTFGYCILVTINLKTSIDREQSRLK